MNKQLLFIVLLVISLNAIADVKSKPYERPIILSGSSQTHVNDATPEAIFVSSGYLQVEVDDTNYSSYTIRLTPSNGGDDIVVNATSSTVTIPVTNTTPDYVVTVDGGDYGVYDGVFSPSDKDSVTLSDTQGSPSEFH